MMRARTTKSKAINVQQEAYIAAATTSASDNDVITANECQRKHRRRKIGPINYMKLCAGTCFSIVMMVFMALVDFQPANKIQKEPLIHKVLKRRGSDQDEWPPPTNNGSICWFDGQCMERTVCSPNEESFGTCVSFGLQSNTEKGPEPAAQACVDACVAELQVDEHFYHETWPNVQASYNFDSDSYPSGCTVIFKREPQGNHFIYLDELDRNAPPHIEVSPSVKQWVDHRFRHVKRVDPLNDDANDSRWMALCSHPCETDSDCMTRMSKTAFVCLQGSCQRNVDYWPHQNVTIVTGATSSYFHGLTNLVASANYWAPFAKVVVYNLGGLEQTEKDEIRSWPNVLSLEWPDGVPKDLPPHVHEGKKYAWKPPIVNETLHKYGSIFWLDAGSTLTGPIEPAIDVLHRQGIFLVKGQDTDMQLSHPGSYEWFGYDKSTMATGPHFSGNTQAFLYPSRYVSSVVIPNAACALDIDCIAPEGSFIRNHRYDQTTISILAYQPKVQLGHYTEFLAADQRQLNDDLSKPSFKFVWTSRQGCQYYAMKDFSDNRTISDYAMKLRGRGRRGRLFATGHR
ncbi:hypothetical protein MPSEU_001051700 [Mayamaea pseudoterrestris]|nr:hypothetical protein MPSEU_001051700 [Mayamaea pseudoterrestris]